jgi:hypothetical protein
MSTVALLVAITGVNVTSTARKKNYFLLPVAQSLFMYAV